MLKAGAPMIPFELPRYDGGTFDLAELSGRPFLLAFFRFASCPFCNLRLHQLVQRYDSFGSGFEVVAVFDDSIAALRRHAPTHSAPFPILADPDRTAYRAYGIQRSLIGMITGMVKRSPTLLKGMYTFGMPNIASRALLTMPADFLIRPDDSIHTAYYGNDEGDHLPFDQISEFSAEYRHQGEP